MPIHPFMEFRPGPVSRETAAELNRLALVVTRLTNLYAAPPLRVTQDYAGAILAIDDVPDIRSLKITSNKSGSYWPAEEVYWDGDSWELTGAAEVFLYLEEDPGAAVGDVFPVCLRAAVDGATGKAVYADRDAAGSGGSLTVQEQDGSPSYTSVTTIQVNQADGFVLTQPSAGTALISIQDASNTQVGIVNTTTQTFAGDKVFNGSVKVQDGSSTRYLLLERDGSGRPVLTFIDSTVSVSLYHIPSTGFTIVNNSGSIIYDTQSGWHHDFRCTALGSPVTPSIRVYHTGDAAYRTGQAGTDPVGNVFTSGILTTLGTASVPTWVAVPSTATSSGTAGQMAYDGSFLYVCTAANTWRRVGISSW